jgi:hypothetical protein
MYSRQFLTKYLQQGLFIKNQTKTHEAHCGIFYLGFHMLSFSTHFRGELFRLKRVKSTISAHQTRSNLTIYTGELSIEKIDFNRTTNSYKIEESSDGGYFLLKRNLWKL